MTTGVNVMYSDVKINVMCSDVKVNVMSSDDWCKRDVQ